MAKLRLTLSHRIAWRQYPIDIVPRPYQPCKIEGFCRPDAYRPGTKRRKDILEASSNSMSCQTFTHCRCQSLKKTCLHKTAFLLEFWLRVDWESGPTVFGLVLLQRHYCNPHRVPTPVEAMQGFCCDRYLRRIPCRHVEMALKLRLVERGLWL